MRVYAFGLDHIAVSVFDLTAETMRVHKREKDISTGESCGSAAICTYALVSIEIYTQICNKLVLPCYCVLFCAAAAFMNTATRRITR